MNKYVRLSGYDGQFLLLNPSEKLSSGVSERLNTTRISIEANNYLRNKKKSDSKSRVIYAINHNINYNGLLQKYNRPLLIRENGSFMLLRDDHKIVDEKYRDIYIDKMCNKFGIKNYKINENKSVDVYDDVDISNLNLKEIPFNFNIVYGSFDCSRNSLTSLKGSPKIVDNYFMCGANDLSSLEFSPSKINGVRKRFICGDNKKLNSLKYITMGCDMYYVGLHYLPRIFLETQSFISIEIIVNNQDDYGIWRKDGSFNEIRYKLLVDEHFNNLI